MIISRIQIEDCINTYVKYHIVDDLFHINLVEDFMQLLNGDNYDSDNLTNLDYIKTVIQNNKDKKNAKRLLVLNKPETYISAMFSVVFNYIDKNPGKGVYENNN